MRYETINKLAKDPDFPNEKALRAMVKSGVCPGFYKGTRFYVDTVLLREHLDRSTSGNSREAGDGTAQ